MTRVELIDDEVGMLNWFNEFPGRNGVNDATVASLLDKGLLTIEDGKIIVSPAGFEWLKAGS